MNYIVSGLFIYGVTRAWHAPFYTIMFYKDTSTPPHCILVMCVFMKNIDKVVRKIHPLEMATLEIYSDYPVLFLYEAVTSDFGRPGFQPINLFL